MHSSFLKNNSEIAVIEEATEQLNINLHFK